MRAITLLFGISMLYAAAPAPANDDPFAAADRYAQTGDLHAMRRSYERILESEPHNLRAMKGLATAHAWLGDYAAAETLYNEVLDRHPDDLEALRGLGYARAWDGSYERALEAFTRALALAPDDVGTRKGVAYVYLWSGDYALAEQAFARLASEYPGDTEVLVALGQAQSERGKHRDAVRSYELALAADPSLDAALRGRRSAWDATPSFEASAWYGSTSNADSGLRLVELAWWASDTTRLSASFDDSLSLDNPALVRSGESATTYRAGIMHRFGEHWGVTVDAGLRELPDGDQNLYRGELRWHHDLAQVTAGTQLGDHELGYEDRLYYVGLGVPIGDRWRIESNMYLSETGLDAQEESRWIVNTEYRSERGWSVLVGGGLGRVEETTVTAEQDVTVAHAVAFIPVFGYHRLNLTLRREEIGNEAFNIAMVGFTYRLARNEARF